jgi:hypothetical protein
MKKTNKQQEKVIMHQHRDEFGNIFGAPHPLNAEHAKEKTQKFHDLTIKYS